MHEIQIIYAKAKSRYEVAVKNANAECVAIEEITGLELDIEAYVYIDEKHNVYITRAKYYASQDSMLLWAWRIMRGHSLYNSAVDADLFELFHRAVGPSTNQLIGTHKRKLIDLIFTLNINSVTHKY